MLTLIDVWQIYYIGTRSIKKLLLLIQVRTDCGLNMVNNNADGVERSGIHFKGRAARMSREQLTLLSPDHVFFPLLELQTPS